MKKINVSNFEIDIIHEDDNYFIVHKPAGLLSHESKHLINEPSLAGIMSEKYKSLASVGEDLSRPAIVHRLDKEVSGLMIIPKTNPSFQFFKNSFKKRLIEKTYKALVLGTPKQDEVLINFPISRSKSGFRMAALPVLKKDKDKISNRDLGNILSLEKSRDAETFFQVEKRFINYSLLKLKIKTGRTHQIRVHLSAYNHPILGDLLYSNKKSKLYSEKLGLSRIYLQASALSFKDQSGERKNFSIELDSDFKNILDSRK